MTIVIPYKDDILSGTELLFALRSIEKHLTGFTNLVIIGDKPEWYKGEYVQAKDQNGRKQFNIYSKLLIACEHKSVSPNFIMWNDDHFLLKDIIVLQIMNWYDGSLKDNIKGNHGARYKETIANTLELIPEVLNHDIHTPCIYNKAIFYSLFMDRTDEICIKSYYFNKTREFQQPMKDFKINSILSKEAIKELIKDKLFLSTSTNGMKKPMIEVLNELYPKKSKWEL